MLDDGDFYFEGGLLVLTEQYHRKRGTCCGSGCRHCPFDHVAVPKRAPDVRTDAHETTRSKE